MNAHLNLKSHVRSLHVMSDEQFEFVKTLHIWLTRKKSNLPMGFKDIRDKEISMLGRIIKHRQYHTKDREVLNKLREQYISEKI